MKVELHNHQALGDTVVMTCSVRDLANAIPAYEKRLADDKTAEPAKDWIRSQIARLKSILGYPYELKPVTNYPLIWENNPHVSKFEVADIPLQLGTGIGTQQSNASGLHICNAYRLALEDKLGVAIPQGLIKPDLHLSSTEKADREFPFRYWLITTGGRPQFTSKLWPYDRWQQLVDALPQIKFVQIGLASHYHPRLKGDNVVDMIGESEDDKRGIRRLFRWFYHSDGSIGLVSAQMHIAAAFEKPCVVIAGAREPMSFEAYSFHRYLHNQGCMVCVKSSGDPNPKLKSYRSHTNACWRTSVEGCPVHVSSEYEGKRHLFTKCVAMITVDEVVHAILSYYEGGMLDPMEGLDVATTPARLIGVPINSDSVRIPPPNLQLTADPTPENFINPQTSSPPLLWTGQDEIRVAQGRQPVFKLVCNAHAWGGGERSPAWLLTAMASRGWKSQLIPKDINRVNVNFLALQAHGVEVTNKITEPCDILVMYANDMVYGFSEDMYKVFEKVQAEKKVMILNYKIGKAVDHPMFNNWDLYGFLSSTLQEQFLSKRPDRRTFVLAPPVDIEPFLQADPGNLNRTLHLVRVSTQPERKYPKDIGSMIEMITAYHPSARFSFMAAPQWVPDEPYITKFRQDEMHVIEFLRRGNCFWYPLPDGYTDQGPRVIVEALAFGLPVVADNRDGAKDRVANEVGWLCDSPTDYIEVFKSMDGPTLVQKGRAAKDYARTHFDPELWIEKIMDG